MELAPTITNRPTATCRFKTGVVKSKNWEWTDENLGPGKWGYVSTTVGSKLVIRIDTRAPPERKYDGKVWVSVSEALVGGCSSFAAGTCGL